MGNLKGNHSFPIYLNHLISKKTLRGTEFDLDEVYVKSINLLPSEVLQFELDLGFTGDIHNSMTLKIIAGIDNMEFLGKAAKEFVRRTNKGLKVADNIREHNPNLIDDEN